MFCSFYTTCFTVTRTMPRNCQSPPDLNNDIHVTANNILHVQVWNKVNRLSYPAGVTVSFKEAMSSKMTSSSLFSHRLTVSSTVFKRRSRAARWGSDSSGATLWRGSWESEALMTSLRRYCGRESRRRRSQVVRRILEPDREELGRKRDNTV